MPKQKQKVQKWIKAFINVTEQKNEGPVTRLVEGYAYGDTGFGYFKDGRTYSATLIATGYKCSRYPFSMRRQAREYIEKITTDIDWQEKKGAEIFTILTKEIIRKLLEIENSIE